MAIIVHPPLAPSTRSEPVATPQFESMKPRERTAFGVGILAFGLLVLSQFLAVWPAMVDATAEGAADQRLTLLFGWAHVTVAAEVAVLLGVMLAGVLGALAYMTRQFISYALRGELTKRAEWWYVLLPVQAAALSAIVYFTLQGGLLGGEQTIGLNPYGLAAIAALVGLFARHAMNMLSRVFTQIFGEPDDKKVLPVE